MLTAVIPHPKFPDFKTTIKYIPSLKQTRRYYRSAQRLIPRALPDPNNPADVVRGKNGEPFYILQSPSLEKSFMEDFPDFFVSFTGLPSDLAEQYAETEEEQKGLGVLVYIDVSLEVEADVPDLDESGAAKLDASKKVITKRGTVKWSSALADMATKRETFIPVPTGAGSPSA